MLQGVYAHSADAVFAEEGAQTGFKYFEAFAWYKKYIIQALIAGGQLEKKMMKLFAWHNGHIFPAAPASAAAGNQAAADRDLEAALKALDASGDESEGGSTGGRGFIRGPSMWGGDTPGSTAFNGWGADAAEFDDIASGGGPSGTDDEPIPMMEGEGTQIVPQYADYESGASQDGESAVQFHSSGASEEESAGLREVGFGLLLLLLRVLIAPRASRSPLRVLPRALLQRKAVERPALALEVVLLLLLPRLPRRRAARSRLRHPAARSPAAAERRAMQRLRSPER